MNGLSKMMVLETSDVEAMLAACNAKAIAHSSSPTYYEMYLTESMRIMSLLALMERTTVTEITEEEFANY